MSYYERLRASAERIARHVAFPGKQDAMEQCLVDLEDLLITGQITAEQRDSLREILIQGRDAHRCCLSARREPKSALQGEKVVTYA